MINYTPRSSEEEVKLYLKEKSGHSLTQFENSFQAIQTYDDLIKQKRSINELEQNIKYLKSSKIKLSNRISGILKKSNSWELIKNTFPDITELTDEQKTNFIMTNFQLHLFKFIDTRIKQLNRNISILKNLHFHTEDKMKGIQSETLIVLVWILTFKNSGLSLKESYRETRTLLIWFSKNREVLLKELFGQLIIKSLDAIIRSYERYIQTPSEESKEYKKLAESLYSLCFIDRLD